MGNLEKENKNEEGDLKDPDRLFSENNIKDIDVDVRKLKKDLAEVLNKNNVDSYLNAHDFVLADFLVDSIESIRNLTIKEIDLKEK